MHDLPLDCNFMTGKCRSIVSDGCELDLRLGVVRSKQWIPKACSGTIALVRYKGTTSSLQCISTEHGFSTSWLCRGGVEPKALHELGVS